VGLVVVPQAMAYALLARLTPAYGLYTTFTGACLYWIFGTSKDIVIGVSFGFMQPRDSPLIASTDHCRRIASCRTSHRLG
jgi:MFS superfamily sulfate permease-like transporter